MVQLGVNIDHVATIRQARRGDEPDPVRAAHEAELGGADGITVHLREDRRHIQDRDVELLRSLVKVKLNLEMAPTPEMVAIARRLCPHTAMLVPEGRAEVTTEGGLDVASEPDRMREIVASLKDAGLIVSAFVDPDSEQVRAAAHAGFDVCEVHTGPYAHTFSACGGDFRRPELADALELLRSTGEVIHGLGMRFNAGHALNYHNVAPVAALPAVEELHIGHAIVSRAVYVGLRAAVQQMRQAILEASAQGAVPWAPAPGSIRP